MVFSSDKTLLRSWSESKPERSICSKYVSRFASFAARKSAADSEIFVSLFWKINKELAAINVRSTESTSKKSPIPSGAIEPVSVE
jgi:hypothetical protein